MRREKETASGAYVAACAMLRPQHLGSHDDPNPWVADGGCLPGNVRVGMTKSRRSAEQAFRGKKGPDRRCEWGRRGEEIAARYLRGHRWCVLDRNVYYRCGELDIVALDEGVLVFVEVRSRWGTSGPRPEDTVRFGKQRRLSRAALRYTRVKGLGSLRSRFDVIAVDLRAGQVKAHHRGCFEAVGID